MLTLYSWMKRPSFIARVEAIVQEYTKRVMSKGLADKARRIGELARHYNAYDEMIEARQARTEFNFIPDWSPSLQAACRLQI